MKLFAFNKTEIRIYGGYYSIGGNCIVVKSPSLRVMLDQGINFIQLRKFYGFSIQPDNVEELRAMGVIPPRESYEDVDEIYITHLHLDHLGSLNIPRNIKTYLPSVEIAEIISKSWWFSWKQHLQPKTLSFHGFKNIEETRNVKYVRVSHSAYPSYALRVDTDDISILYTGDLRIERLHEVSPNPLEELEKLSEGGVDVLIIEGTNFGRKTSYLPPKHFRNIIVDVLRKYDGKILFVSVHPLDLEATLTLLELLWKHDFTTVLENPHYAKLLDIMINVSGYRPEGEILFSPRSSRVTHYDNIEIAFLEELKDRRLAVFIPSYGVKDMKDILRVLNENGGGLLHITVLGEPLSEEWIIEMKKLENWLKLLGITSLSIRVSGHYYPHEFKEILRIVKPRKLIPIHTSAPEVMLSLFNKYKQRL